MTPRPRRERSLEIRQTDTDAGSVLRTTYELDIAVIARTSLVPTVTFLATNWGGHDRLPFSSQ